MVIGSTLQGEQYAVYLLINIRTECQFRYAKTTCHTKQSSEQTACQTTPESQPAPLPFTHLHLPKP
jgi:hypothetical protein